MNRKICAVLALILLISFVMPFQANADTFEQWDSNYGPHQISLPYAGLYAFSYDCTENQTVEFCVNADDWLHLYVYYLNTPIQVPVVRMIDNDKVHFIVTFQALCNYKLSFYYGNTDITEPAVATVTTAAWSDSSYRTVKPDVTNTITIDPERSVTYLVKVPASGLYSLVANDANFDYSLSCYPVDMPENYPSPAFLLYDPLDGKYRAVYYLDADVTYGLEVFGYGNTATCTGSFVLQSGSFTDQVGVLNEGVAQNVTVDPSKSESVTYAFVPKSSGKYYINNDGDLHPSLRGPSGEYMEGTQYFAQFVGGGTMYTLEKGKCYTVMFYNSTSSKLTGNFTVNRYDSVKSLDLKVIQHTGEFITVGLFSDPACAVGDNVKWSISDESVFSMQEWGSHVELTAKKNGSAVVKATVGGKTASLTVSTHPETQTMTLGKPAYLYLRGQTPAAVFTAPETGKYEMKLDTYLWRDTDTMRVIVKKPDGGFLYDNYQLSGDQTVTLDLIGGTKYEILLENGIVEVTFTKLSSSTPVNPNQPTTSTTPTVTPTVPPQGGNTTLPTTGTSSTTPPAQDATTPGQNESQPSGGDTTSTTPPDSGDTTVPGIDNNEVTDVVTKDDVKDAIDEALKFDQTLHYAVVGVDNRTLEMTAEALQAAVDNGLSLSTDFICGTTVSLPNEVLESLSNNGDEGSLKLTVTPQHFGVLNQQQSAAIEGLAHGKLLDIALSVSDRQIHQLGGTAEITLENPDSTRDWRVLYLAEDGSVEDMKCTSDDKSITFYTDHFSYFVLAHDMSVQAVNSNGGSGVWIVIAIVVVVLAGAAVAFFVLKKKGMIPFKK